MTSKLWINDDTGHSYDCFCSDCLAWNSAEDAKRQDERNRKEYTQQLANRLLFATIRYDKAKSAWTDPVPSKEAFMELAHAEIEYQKVTQEIKDFFKC